MPTKKKLCAAELLYRSAQQIGMQPSWVLPKSLFAVSVGGREKYINYTRSPLNSQSSASISCNKYLTRLVLERHGMRNIPFARVRTLSEAEAFLAIHEKIIAKPIKGSGAKGICIITDALQLANLEVKKYILERYISGEEMRYLVLNDKVIGVHRSDYGTSVEETRALKRISYPKEVWDETLVGTSTQIARALGLRFVAVDYLVDSYGSAHVLEVNTAPGLKWFHSPTSGPVVDVASSLMQAILTDEESSSTITSV